MYYYEAVLSLITRQSLAGLTSNENDKHSHIILLLKLTDRLPF